MKRRPALLLVAVVLLAITPHLAALPNEFVFDDTGVIVQNQAVTRFDLPAIWTSPYWPTLVTANLYRPLTSTSYAIDWAVGGGKATPFVVTNLLIHLGATLGALWLLRRLFPNQHAVAWAAATATMIGQALGAQNPIRAKRVGHEAVLQCGMLSLAMTAFYYFGAAFIYDKMSLDPLVRAAGVRPFQVLALLQPCMTVSIIYIGGLRGAGDTRFPLLITLLGVLIRIPTGYYFGIVLGWGLIGAWMGMFGDMIWRSMSATLRFVGGRWLTTRV